ncbi:sec34-like family protein [Cystoisospora suis]|uniref:Sec34-like family protein n=1 Tax=Cystoisospora suis TaxID=483139 RepID=A0A2C6KLX3_9APIC|nr:sec34-like family protein [Cystoisospora suis]
MDKAKASQLAPFLSIVVQLVHDVQERLVFRADAEVEEKVRLQDISEENLILFFLSSLVGSASSSSSSVEEQQHQEQQKREEGIDRERTACPTTPTTIQFISPVENALRIISLLHRAMSSDYAFSSLCGSTIEACLDTMKRVYTTVSKCLGMTIATSKKYPKLHSFFVANQRKTSASSSRSTRDSSSFTPIPTSSSESSGSSSSSSSSSSSISLPSRDSSSISSTGDLDDNTPLDVWLWMHVSFELSVYRTREVILKHDKPTQSPKELSDRKKDEEEPEDNYLLMLMDNEEEEKEEEDKRLNKSKDNERWLSLQNSSNSSSSSPFLDSKKTDEKAVPSSSLFLCGVKGSHFHEILQELFMLEHLLIVEQYLQSLGENYQFTCTHKTVALPSFSLPFFSRGRSEDSHDKDPYEDHQISLSSSASPPRGVNSKKDEGEEEEKKKKQMKGKEEDEERDLQGQLPYDQAYDGGKNTKTSSSSSFLSWLIPRMREEVYDARALLVSTVRRHAGILISSISSPLISPLTRLLIQLPKDMEEETSKTSACISSSSLSRDLQHTSRKKKKRREEETKKKDTKKDQDRKQRGRKDEEEDKDDREEWSGEKERERERMEKGAKERKIRNDLPLCFKDDSLRLSFTEYFFYLKRDLPQILLTLLLLLDAPAAASISDSLALSSTRQGDKKEERMTLAGGEEEQGHEKDEEEIYTRMIESIRFILCPILNAILHPYRQMSAVLFSYLDFSEDEARHSLRWISEEELRLAIVYMAVYKVAPVALRVYRQQTEVGEDLSLSTT